MGRYAIARRIEISAPPGRVRALVSDFREWRRWSPWEGLDPDMHREYSGPASGEGAYYAWSGDRKAGEGNMMVGSSTLHTITIQLVFVKPWKANNPTRFDFEPVDAGTLVTWTMHGQTQGVAGVFASLFGIERSLGKDFERGLLRLKAAAEATG